jgi:predicted RNA-binding protein with PUA-like domain
MSSRLVSFPAVIILVAFRLSMQPMTGLIGVRRLTERSLSSLSRRRLTTSTRLLSAQTPNYFLLKSEPSEFSIQDLEECGEEEWDGERNYQARNKLRAMKVGDLAYFYHSICSVPGIVGTMRIVREVAPDETALDPNHNGYDPKSTPGNCRWDAVRLRFETKFHEPITLRQLKKRAKEDLIFSSLSLLQQSRLSVHSSFKDQSNAIASLASPATKEESEPQFFVIKSNPSKFSIQDLNNQRGIESDWTFSGKGQAELLQSIRPGVLAFFYHSGCSVPGIVGKVEVIGEVQQGIETNGSSLRIRLESIFPETLRLQEIKAAAVKDRIIGTVSLAYSRSNL